MNQRSLVSDTESPEFDIKQRYVLIRNERSDGFIEFDYSVGEPEVFVEMILPRPAFDEFCLENDVAFITEADVSETALAEQVWRLSETSGKNFN